MKRKKYAHILFTVCMINAVLLGAFLSVLHGRMEEEALFRNFLEADAQPPDSTMAGDRHEKSAQNQDRSAGNDEKKIIALTFDDGPHPVYTKELLQGLRERNVRVSFFLVGQNIKGNEDIVREMQTDGHLIGNHSNTHVQLNAGSMQNACDEIEQTNQRIYEATGQRPVYIRPPFGSWSEDLECLVPMTVVLWNIDPLDWKLQNTRKVVSHVLKHTEDGSIVLLHDSYQTSVEAALEIIDTLTRQGYTFVTVDEMMID